MDVQTPIFAYNRQMLIILITCCRSHLGLGVFVSSLALTASLTAAIWFRRS